MATKYTGHSFEVEDVSSEVTKAVIGKNRLSIEWIEDGEVGYLEATSEDGEFYRGNFGYPLVDPYYRVELRLYRAASGDRILFGRWTWADGSGTGCWLFRLSPISEE